jgi:hypothetical protein
VRRGTRLKANAPFGHWATQTFIAGLRCDGLTAPWVIDHPMNRETFDTYVETQLAPTLRQGDVVRRRFVISTSMTFLRLLNKKARHRPGGDARELGSCAFKRPTVAVPRDG